MAGAATVVASLPFGVFGAVAPEIGRDFRVGTGSLGFAVGAFFLAGAASSVAAGRRIERLGPQAGLRNALGCVIASALGIWLWGRSIGSLSAWMALAGVGNGFVHPSANAILARARSNRPATWLGMKQAAIPAAIALAGVVSPQLAARWTWELAFGLVGLLALGLMPAVRAVGQTHSRMPVQAMTQPKERYRWGLVVATGALAGAAATSLGAFLVTAAVNRGFDIVAAGLQVASASALGMTARVVWGIMVDRCGSHGLMALTLLLTSGSASYLVIAFGEGWIFVLGGVLAFSTGWGWPGVHQFAALYGVNEPATATGWAQLGALLGAAFGALGFGQVADRWSIGVAWTVSASLAGLAGLLAFAQWMNRRQDSVRSDRAVGAREDRSGFS